MMVERFGFEVHELTALFLLNFLVSMAFAPFMGRAVAWWGERRVLVFEYAGLVCVFLAYGGIYWLHWGVALAAGLYIVDHLFFALAIAIKTYFQKIADPADIASTAGVSFTINHVAAVVIPAAFGFLWLVSPAAVFLAGSAMATGSLILAMNVPRHPRRGEEVLIGRVAAPAATA
jgi:hypothetical protein